MFVYVSQVQEFLKHQGLCHARMVLALLSIEGKDSRKVCFVKTLSVMRFLVMEMLK